MAGYSSSGQDGRIQSRRIEGSNLAARWRTSLRTPSLFFFCCRGANILTLIRNMLNRRCLVKGPLSSGELSSESAIKAQSRETVVRWNTYFGKPRTACREITGSVLHCPVRPVSAAVWTGPWTTVDVLSNRPTSSERRIEVVSFLPSRGHLRAHCHFYSAVESKIS